MNLKKYEKAVQDQKKSEPIVKDVALAFLGGGAMGLIAQGLIDLYHNVAKLTMKESMALMAMTVVFVTSLLTLIGWYKKIGRIFGAGLFLPTTGFANSVVSSSIEGRHEGFIIGVGGQIFALAGSVITYGVSFSALFLIIKYFLTLWGIAV